MLDSEHLTGTFGKCMIQKYHTFSGLQDNVWYLYLSKIDMTGHLTCTSGICPVYFHV